MNTVGDLCPGQNHSNALDHQSPSQHTLGVATSQAHFLPLSVTCDAGGNELLL